VKKAALDFGLPLTRFAHSVQATGGNPRNLLNRILFDGLGWGINLIWENSTQSVLEPVTLDLALARYKQGKCPCCGKSTGETKGLEYRARSKDLYCHTCKRRWPAEMDLVDLQLEFQIPNQPVPERQLADLNPQSKTSGVQLEIRGLSRLFRRIVLKR